MAAIQVLGEVSIGSLFPALLGLLSGIKASISGDLDGVLAMAAEVQIDLPSVAAAISAAEQVLADLMASTGGIGFNATVDAALILELGGYLDLISKFIFALGGSSALAELCKYAGPANAFGAAVNVEFGGGVQGSLPGDQIQAILLVTKYPAFVASFLQLVGIA
jgi:hypothetical protein